MTKLEKPRRSKITPHIPAVTTQPKPKNSLHTALKIVRSRTQAEIYELSALLTVLERPDGRTPEHLDRICDALLTMKNRLELATKIASDVRDKASSNRQIDVGIGDDIDLNDLNCQELDYYSDWDYVAREQAMAALTLLGVGVSTPADLDPSIANMGRWTAGTFRQQLSESFKGTIVNLSDDQIENSTPTPVNPRIAKAASLSAKSLQLELQAQRLLAMNDLDGMTAILQRLTSPGGVTTASLEKISNKLTSCRFRLTQMYDQIEKASRARHLR